MIRVAIDGPAGVGKSSTSKALAKYFGYAYLDTGAMYRACAWWCLKQDIDLDAETVDERVITEAVGEFFTGDHFDISVDPDNPRVFADDEDISEAIRSSEVSSHVSKVSNVIPVRNVLIAAQRAGWIRRVGFTPSTLKSTKNALVRVYAPIPGALDD